MALPSPQRVAIIGFGFSGLMVAANLVRNAATSLVLYIITPDAPGFGMAYGTTDVDHLLNVPAAKMGAVADAVEGFYHWLQTAEAAAQKKRLGLNKDYRETDFAPRALYAAYLQSIWHSTQDIAAQKKIELKLVPSTAVGITPGDEPAVLTERGDAIAVDAMVLATGHEIKPVMAHLPAEYILQSPWVAGAFMEAKEWPSPVVLMGTGLTAVDTIMSLRNAGYAGEIIAFSRHGFLPQPHKYGLKGFAFDAAALSAQNSLAALMRYVRRAMTQHGEWRDVVDALRPHTQKLWQKLSTRDQQLFLARVLSFWSVHRHRMAPEISARVQQEIASGGVRIIASKRFEASVVEGKALLTLHAKNATHDLWPGKIINCTGPEMNVARSKQPLLKQALADGVVESHATGLGVAVDLHARAWGALHPQFYIVGPLMTGQWLESTAVPELRVQAATAAEQLLKR